MRISTELSGSGEYFILWHISYLDCGPNMMACVRAPKTKNRPRVAKKNGKAHLHARFHSTMAADGAYGTPAAYNTEHWGTCMSLLQF